MNYGQGKDIQANYQKLSRHGQGTIGILNMIGDVGNAVSDGFNGNYAGAIQNLQKGFNDFKTGIESGIKTQKTDISMIPDKQLSSNQNISNSISTPVNNNLKQQQQKTNNIVTGNMDTNAGFNPKSETFRNGQGQVQNLRQTQISSENSINVNTMSNKYSQTLQNNQMALNAKNGTKLNLNYFNYIK